MKHKKIDIVSSTYMVKQWWEKAARIGSRICEVILGLATKRHMEREHIIFIEVKNISDWDLLCSTNSTTCELMSNLQ